MSIQGEGLGEGDGLIDDDMNLIEEIFELVRLVELDTIELIALEIEEPA
jgi:hypothetical protein